MKSFLVCFALIISTCAHAVSESDFAYGYTLEVDGDGAIYSLELPQAVYRGLTRPDRGDLRVFNSQGVSVPHYIKRAEQMTRKTLEDINLPIFPLYNDTLQAQGATGQDVHIVTNDKGAIIDINYGKYAGDKTRMVSAYILDCSQLIQAPNALILNWPESEVGFAINAEVAGSNDLTHWEPIIVRRTLTNLQFKNHALIQRRIELPLHKFKYLRLNWLGDKSLTLIGVQARFPATYESNDRQWSTFNVTSYSDSDHAYLFDTHSVLPADRVSIELPQRNTLLTVNLWSSATGKDPWRLRYSGMLYNLQIRGDEIRTPEQVMPLNTDRYWKLRVPGHGEKLQSNPVLRLGWIPEQLYFIAQGEAPFTLAYGSARVGPSDTTLAQLLDVDKMRDKQDFIKPAQLGSSIELGNQDMLNPPGQPLDWKQIILWLVLILGVIVLAIMAYKLYKQMEQSQPGE